MQITQNVNKEQMRTYIEPGDISQLSSQKESKSQDLQVLSEYKYQYDYQMRDIEDLQVQDFQKVLFQNSITYHPSKFFKATHYQIMQTKKNAKIVEVRARLSYFTFHLKIYNCNHSSPARNLQKRGAGSFGTVYQYVGVKNEKLVIKNIQYPQEADISFQLRKAIQEYCFCKLSSCFQIGPKISHEMGFDLITYTDSIEFMMENCQTEMIEPLVLKKDLKFLHKLKIVHGDIKKQNIMFSPSFQKNVFIDFNCSSAVQNPIGHTNLTRFKGTPNQCLPQMKQLWNTREEGQIDLFYNDVYALQMEIEEQKKIAPNYISPAKKKEVQKSQRNYCWFYSHLKLRSLFFQNNYKQFEQYLTINFDKLIVTQKFQEAKSTQGTVKSQLQAHHYQQKRQICSEIIDTINQTILFCHQVSLNPNVIKANKLLNQKFKKWIDPELLKLSKNNNNNLKESLKIFAKYSFSSKISDILNNQFNIDSDIIYFLLFNFFKKNDESISKSIMLLFFMKLDKKQQKKLTTFYYQFLECAPNAQLLEKAVNIFEQENYLKYAYKQTIIGKMLTIDEHFQKGKLNLQCSDNNKNKLFGIKSCINLQAFKFFLDYLDDSQKQSQQKISHLKMIYEDLAIIINSDNQSAEKDKQLINNFQYGLQKLVNSHPNVIKQRQCNFIINLLKFIHIVLNDQDQYDPKTNMQSIIKDLTESGRQYNARQQFYDFLYSFSQGKQSVYDEQEYENLIKLSKKNPIFQYRHLEKIILSRIIRQIKLNNTLMQNQLRDMVGRLQKYQTCEHCWINSLSRIIQTLSNFPNFATKHENFVQFILQKCSKYFCVLSNRNKYQKKTVNSLNRTALSLLSITSNRSNNFGISVQKYKDWVNNSPENQRIQFIESLVRFYFIKGDYKSSQDLAILSIKKYSQEILQNYQSGHKKSSRLRRFKLTQLRKICLYLYKTTILIDGRLVQIRQFEKIMDFYIDGSLQIQQSDYFETISSINGYLFNHKKFDQIFQFLSAVTSLLEVNNLKALFFYFSMQKQIFCFQEDEDYNNCHIIDFIIAIEDRFLNKKSSCPASIKITIFLLCQLVFCWRTRIFSKNLKCLHPFMMKGLRYLLKNIKSLPLSLVQRIRQNLIPMVYWLKSIYSEFPMLDIEVDSCGKQHIEQYIHKQFSNKQLEINNSKQWLSKIKLNKIMMKNFKRTIIKNQHGNFEIILKKLMQKQKFKTNIVGIRDKIFVRISKYFQNKTLTLKIKNLQDLEVVHSKLYEVYFNSWQLVFSFRRDKLPQQNYDEDTQ